MSRRHHRKRRSRRSAPGAAPGSFQVHPASAPTRIRVFRYGGGEPPREERVEVGELPSLVRADGALWIDVVGLGDREALEKLAELFHLHRLTLEDISNTHQRPKTEEFASYLYVVLRAPVPADHLILGQLSLVVGDGFLISFEEAERSCLDPVRERIRHERGVVCSRGIDYLAYAILDSAIDHYFPLFDGYADRLEELEKLVLGQASRRVLPQLYSLKEDLRECRRSVLPLRDLIAGLLRGDHVRFEAETRVHLRDCADHVMQILELIESDRDTATGLMELHVSNTGNRMNEVMKVLTIIATIFIPLSFIAGLYGMNFDPRAGPLSMPELGWRWGYPATLLMMAGVALGMLYFFWRRGWLSPEPGLGHELEHELEHEQEQEHEERRPPGDR